MTDAVIAVIGLGYVGLPLAVEFGKRRAVIGFDRNPDRIAALRAGRDETREVPDADLAAAAHLSFSADPADLSACQIFIVAVPTPVDAQKRPDLSALFAASRSVGGVLKPGDVVIYESTVYPGATEDDCAPILEEVSGLRRNVDFWLGYSPERINPGDKHHRLPDIVKVTSGSTPRAADAIDALYGEIITAGTYKAESIRVAEAAKVIENTQRDLNIALVNELAMIFNRMGIDTDQVLRAAGTKWNFLPFRPGLVGGHCIGVDPYYLTYKAEAFGHHPQVILAGRRINDGMGSYVATQMVKALLARDIHVKGTRILVLGLAFKANCPDLRNTRVIDVIRELESFGFEVDVHDPWVDPHEAQNEYGVSLLETPQPGTYNGVLLAVDHATFADQGSAALRAYGTKEHVFFDLKSQFQIDEADLRL